MRIIDKLERKIGRFAIKNLAVYLVVGNAAVWLLGFALANNDVAARLILAPSLVFKGEVWRVFTFVFLNSFGSSPISVILELYFLYIIGRNLENSWGSFRLTLYYFVGFALTVAVSLSTGYIASGARYIHLSLFFAFAALAPEMRILLFFFIPVKIKWLAWAAWAFTAYEFIIARSWAGRLFILAPFAAFIIFFGPEIIRALRLKRQSVEGRRKFEKKKNESRVLKMSFHKCEICGITEIDAPDMDFRYCSKCAGDYEYCAEHLKDHYHRSG